jgi:hypothetical protein
LKAGMTPTASVSNLKHFASDEILAKYEREAINDGLAYCNDMLFENGAKYEGYTKD